MPERQPQRGGPAAQKGWLEMPATAARKRMSAADIAAAVSIGAMAPDAQVSTDVEETSEPQPEQTPVTSTAVLPADHHECGIPGCRHGAAHDGPSQPDRQVKLEAPCGAVARMTGRALARAGGAIQCAHGDAFTVAARRAYRRNGGAA